MTHRSSPRIGSYQSKHHSKNCHTSDGKCWRYVRTLFTPLPVKSPSQIWPIQVKSPSQIWYWILYHVIHSLTPPFLFLSHIHDIRYSIGFLRLWSFISIASTCWSRRITTTSSTICQSKYLYASFFTCHCWRYLYWLLIFAFVSNNECICLPLLIVNNELERPYAVDTGIISWSPSDHPSCRQHISHHVIRRFSCHNICSLPCNSLPFLSSLRCCCWPAFMPSKNQIWLREWVEWVLFVWRRHFTSSLKRFAKRMLAVDYYFLSTLSHADQDTAALFTFFSVLCLLAPTHFSEEDLCVFLLLPFTHLSFFLHYNRMPKVPW